MKILNRTDNNFFWILISFLIKGVIILFLYFNHLFSDELIPELNTFKSELIGNYSGDSFSYILSIENLIEKGKYTYDLNNKAAFAGRMPGLGIIYLLFRIFFSKQISLNLLILFQMAFASIATLYFAKIIYFISSNIKLFYLSFFLMAINVYNAIWEFYILTESIATSSLIFCVYYLIKFNKNKNYIHLLISGLFLTWCIFLRPIMAPFMIIFIFILIFFQYRASIKTSIKNIILSVVVFLIPFIMIDGIWLIRNYQIYERLIPLQVNGTAGYKYDRSFLELVKFVQAWGGDYVSWENSAEIKWFDKFAGTHHRDDLGNRQSLPSHNVLPNYIYTSFYNYDSLLILRSDILNVNNLILSKSDREEFDGLASQKLVEYRSSFINEKPFYYYFVAPLRLIKKFLLHSGTQNLFSHQFSDLSLTNKIIKAFYSFYYLATIVLGLLGIVFFLYKYSNEFEYLLILSIPVYFIIVLAGVLRMVEYRYFVPAFPYMLACSILFFSQILEFLKNKLELKFLKTHQN